jgi:hypothetical protein
MTTRLSPTFRTTSASAEVTFDGTDWLPIRPGYRYLTISPRGVVTIWTDKPIYFDDYQVWDRRGGRDCYLVSLRLANLGNGCVEYLEPNLYEIP